MQIREADAAEGSFFRSKGVDLLQTISLISDPSCLPPARDWSFRTNLCGILEQLRKSSTEPLDVAVQDANE
jgi:hypothetical protein